MSAETDEREEQVARWLRPCGDSGCILLDRTSRGGQHTNGGCRHLQDAPREWRRMIHVFAAEIVRLRDLDAERVPRARDR